ncbi:hypothetical protein Mapa_008203 [Marchantia paleacea]|nr:hypothetical protein Mapa_008203 [Marchantia paleacea]
MDPDSCSMESPTAFSTFPRFTSPCFSHVKLAALQIPALKFSDSRSRSDGDS